MTWPAEWRVLESGGGLPIEATRIRMAIKKSGDLLVENCICGEKLNYVVGHGRNTDSTRHKRTEKEGVFKE